MTLLPLKRLAVPLGLAAALCSAPAFADSTTSLNVSALTWQLIDLNPGDGIAPEVGFFDHAYSSSVQINTPSYVDFDLTSSAGTSSLAFYKGSGSSSAGPDALSATITFSREAGTQQIVAGGTHDLGFYLKPYTGIVFSAVTEFNLDAAYPTDDSAQAQLRGRFSTSGDRASTLDFHDNIYRTQGGPYTYVLSAFAHAEETGGVGYLTLSSQLRAEVVTSPVPEPASVSMLLAGLALVGGTAWRKRQRGG